MFINKSKLPYNQGSSNPEGVAPKENYFTKCRRRIHQLYYNGISGFSVVK